MGNRSCVLLDECWGLINKQGELIIDCIYTTLYSHSNKGAYIATYKNKTFYLDSNGASFDT